MKLPTVESRPLTPDYTRVDVNADAFGASIAKGVIDASTTAGNIAADIMLKEDRQATLSIVSNAQDLYNSKMTEYQSRRLSDAKGVTDEARTEFEKIKKDALKTATNDRQARIVDEALTHQIVGYLGTTRNHEAEQDRAYTVQVANDMLSSSQDAVKIDPLNEETAWVAKHNAAAAIGNRDTGLSPEELTTRKAAAVSSVTASQLSSLLAQGRNADFLVLYPQIKDELVGSDADQFAKYATATVDLHVQQQLTTKLFMAYPDDSNAAYEAARSTLDAKDEEAVISGLKTRYAEKETGQKIAQAADVDAAGAAFLRGNWKVSSIPADIRQRVTDKNPQAMISLSNLETQHALGVRGSIKSDPVEWQKAIYYNDDERVDPKNDPLTIADKLNEADYQHLVKLKAEAMQRVQGLKADTTKPTWTATDLNKLLTDKFSEVFKATDTDQSKQRFKVYENNVRQAVERYQALNGKPPTYEQIEKEIAYQLVEGARVGQAKWYEVGSDKAARRFQAKPGETFRPDDINTLKADPLAVIESVPQAEALKIASSLKKAGKAVTREMILRTWQEANAFKAGAAK